VRDWHNGWRSVISADGTDRRVVFDDPTQNINAPVWSPAGGGLRSQALTAVLSRSFPFHKQFESGFPFGHNQWISAAASSWATMALPLTVASPAE
jgi:hypothetical protein